MAEPPDQPPNKARSNGVQRDARVARPELDQGLPGRIRSGGAWSESTVIPRSGGLTETDQSVVLNAPKSDPAEVARIALDGIEKDQVEILADDVSATVRAGLAHDGQLWITLPGGLWSSIGSPTTTRRGLPRAPARLGRSSVEPGFRAARRVVLASPATWATRMAAAVMRAGR